MRELPPALAAMGAYRQFIVYVAQPSRSRPGKTDKFPADFRSLERACMMSDGTAEGVAKYIAARLVDGCAKWDSDTGDVNPESKQVAEQIAREFLSFFNVAGLPAL